MEVAWVLAVWSSIVYFWQFMLDQLKSRHYIHPLQSFIANFSLPQETVKEKPRLNLYLCSVMDALNFVFRLAIYLDSFVSRCCHFGRYLTRVVKQLSEV